MRSSINGLTAQILTFHGAPKTILGLHALLLSDSWGLLILKPALVVLAPIWTSVHQVFAAFLSSGNTKQVARVG